MKRTLAITAAAALAAAGVAFAAGTDEVRKQAESSMLVTGTIQVDPEGRVSGYTLDQQDQLPKVVVDVGQRVPHWRFEPVLDAGQPAQARADMSIRLVARKIDEGHYSVAVRSAAFGDEISAEAASERMEQVLKARREREDGG